MKAEAAPEIDQACLRVAIGPAIALFLAKLEPRINQLEGGAGLAELLADYQPFKLCELGKKAHPQVTGRFVADIGQKMRGSQIVAVDGGWLAR